MGNKHLCFFETAETGNRAPNSGLKGSGANHYPRAPARVILTSMIITNVNCMLSLHLWQQKMNDKCGGDAKIDKQKH